MDEVVVNGVRYIPADQTPPPRIGIGLTTRNRPDILNRALKGWRQHLPAGAELVIVDDASDTPVPDATYRFEDNVGIARAKNKCLELLTDLGVTDYFLADDDVNPTVDDWYLPYVESSEPHAMYVWGEHAIYRDENVVGYLRPKGALLYANRTVIDRVGGEDSRFGLWGFEHESWSDRIHNAGLTTCRYQDVVHEPGIFYAADEHETIPSSVPEHVRLASNPELAEANRDSAAYIPYRDTPTQAPATVTLSVLVASVHTRRHSTAPRLVDDLFGQWEQLPPADQRRVEVMVLTDTKTMPLGTKRNTMVSDASGDYVAFVDDDDRIEPDYLTALLDAIDTHPDVVTFHVNVTVDGNRPKLCRYSIDYTEDHDTPNEYRRLPNHICAVRRDLVLRNPFPDVRYGEDREYAARLKPLLLTEHNIGRVLYHYDYDRTTTETQLAQRYQHQIVTRTRPPVVDVVILSDAHTPELAAMTRHTITTCRAGAGDHPINIVVIEQTPAVRHPGAITIHQPGDFAYNAFANRAAATGTAPWILVANNDLDFQTGWLDPLLHAKHPVVSPLNPGDNRQANIRRNETGTVNGRHFSGWCFMIARTLWGKIGGFDEDFKLWCADDSVIEQVTRAGTKPMLVPDSKVRHLTSKTVGPNPPDELTWGMVALFEEKYGVKKFENDKRYTAWKRRHHTQLKSVPA